MTHGKPPFPAGTSFHCSDTGYILLGEMLERETGHSLATAFRTLLGLDRLGLHHERSRDGVLDDPQAGRA